MKGNHYRILGDIAECILSNGQKALVSPESIPELKKYTWCLSGNGYAMTRSCAQGISMQRLLTNAKTGDIVDHIDRNPLNNTLDNLRICTKRENAINTKTRSDNSVGYRGVSQVKTTGRYRAYICINGKQKHLGMYESPEEAAAQYEKAAKKLYGDFTPDFAREDPPCQI